MGKPAIPKNCDFQYLHRRAKPTQKAIICQSLSPPSTAHPSFCIVYGYGLEAFDATCPRIAECRTWPFEFKCPLVASWLLIHPSPTPTRFLRQLLHECKGEKVFFASVFLHSGKARVIPTSPFSFLARNIFGLIICFCRFIVCSRCVVVVVEQKTLNWIF